MLQLSRRSRSLGLSCLVASAIGCDDDDRSAPPPGVTGVAMSNGGELGDTGGSPGDTGTDTGDTETGGDTDTDTEGTADVLLSGTLDNDDGAATTLPLTCSIRFHGTDQIDPDTAQEDAFSVLQSVVVESWPTPFEVTIEEVGLVVEPGDDGYVTVTCGIDSDPEVLFRGWEAHPLLPLSLLRLPVQGIDLVVGAVQ